MDLHPASAHERLDVAMNKRREALHLTWANVASGAQITVETLRAIRRGNNQPSALTKRGIENALHWEPGSVDLVIAGEHPIPLDQSAPRPSVAAEAKAPATEVDTDKEIDLETFVPETPTERALIAIYRATEQARQDQKKSQQAIEEKLEHLTKQVNRLSVVHDPDNAVSEYDNGHDQQQKGA